MLSQISKNLGRTICKRKQKLIFWTVVFKNDDAPKSFVLEFNLTPPTNNNGIFPVCTNVNIVHTIQAFSLYHSLFLAVSSIRNCRREEKRKNFWVNMSWRQQMGGSGREMLSGDSDREGADYWDSRGGESIDPGQ